MKGYPKTQYFWRIVIVFMVVSMLVSWQPGISTNAQNINNDILYTTDADFDRGTLVSVNHTAPNNNQLQLDSPTKPFPFINVAASGRGTVVRANTETGEIVGEYRTAPEGRGMDPSRTTVDLFGNVWTANRAEAGEINGLPHGSTVKIGLIVGGTRVDENGSPTPEGGYLAPPFGYNTCIDRNGDGLIRTSNGLGNILDWPDVTDGMGGADGVVQDAVDECVLIYQRLPDAEGARHVSVDADNNVWVGGYPYVLRMFYKLDGITGALLDSFDARKIGCGGYGGLIDGNGILWSVGGNLLRYDPAAKKGFCIPLGGYGLGIDLDGYIWMSIWDGGIAKIAPDGTVIPGFPKHTYPPSLLASTLETAEMTGLLASLPQHEAGAAVRPPARDTRVPTQMPVAGAPKLRSPSKAAETIEKKPVMTSSPRAAVEEAGDPLADPAVPTFQVAPVDEWVESMSPWTPGSIITLTIRVGGAVVYSASQTANSSGSFWFGTGGMFDLQTGQEVTVTDGTTTKTHTILPLNVQKVDVVADTISGRADPAASVDIWVHGDGGLTVTPDSSGNWTADFSAQTDLIYLSDGGTHQFDDDGDATGVWWAAPRLQAAPEDNWVQSSGTWTSGATIMLTINDGGAVVFSDSQAADTYGHFNFNVGSVFDLQRGQEVTVSDGTTTKSLTVTGLFTDVVDVAADTVSGRAAAGTDVEVWVDGDGNQFITVDGAGSWTADFSGQTDLTYQNTGGSQQRDTEGDTTFVWWSAPRIQVAPEDEWVSSWSRWTSGTTVTLTIQDGGAVVYSDTRVVDASGNFNFNLWDVFDLQRGQEVTVSDGMTTKTHTIMPLYVDIINLAAETISGRADPGANVSIWVHGDGSLTVTPDSSGNWTADFAAQTNLTYLNDGGSQQIDADGDSTGVWWSSPRLEVQPDDDWVQSWNRWKPGTQVNLVIQNGGAVVYSDIQVTDSHGNFHFNLGGVFDLKRGQEVTVSDGTMSKSVTVANLYIDNVDIAADTVMGRASANASMEVWVNGYSSKYFTANGAGNWTADFSGTVDMTYLSEGGSREFDDDGDATDVWWASPRFVADPDDNWVQARSRWAPGANITLTIKDGGAVVYLDTQVADSSGNFNFNLRSLFDLQRGQEVTVSDGTITKTHTILPLFVDSVNPPADTIAGRCIPDTKVEIWVNGDGSQVVTADGSGNWTADFSSQTDVTYYSDGGAQQYDDDGDATHLHWSTPSFQVDPANNSVGAWNRWKAGTNITLTVEAGAAEVYSNTLTTDSNGGFNFSVDWGILVTGNLVTVTDGTTTKTHTITAVTIDEINPAADQVQGTANPGARVRVGVNSFTDGAERTVSAGTDGKWLADFSVAAQGQPAYDVTSITFVSANEFDEDGDSTYRRGGPPVLQNRGVAVTPADNNVWIANSGTGSVTRLDNDGNVLKVIPTGDQPANDQPTGVAVDATGKVWATNMGSSTAVRIDPNGGGDGLGAVDLTVNLGPDAGPYNYSDMTGAVVVGSTSPQGFWTVVQDSQALGFAWGHITWNTEPQGSEPEGTAIIIEARAADTEAGLGGQPFQPVVNGELFSMLGRFIEVRATLKASPSGVSPVLSDIRIQPSVITVVIDIKPGSYPNSINCLSKKETVTVAILSTADFDALSVDYTTVTFEGAKEMHVDSKTKLPVRHVEDVGLDGDMDLVFHFRVPDTALTCASTTGTLIGKTYAGISIVGTDSVRMTKK